MDDIYNNVGALTQQYDERMNNNNDPLTVLTEYLNAPIADEATIFLYYFFDKKKFVLQEQNNGVYRGLNKPYKTVFNSVLRDVLEDSNANLNKRQTRETYVRFALRFNSLSKENYDSRFHNGYPINPVKLRPKPIDWNKMDQCLNAIGEEALNPAIFEEAVWIFGLELNMSDAECDALKTRIELNGQPEVRDDATAQLVHDLDVTIINLKNHAPKDRDNEIVNFFADHPNCFKGFSQNRQGAWNILKSKYLEAMRQRNQLTQTALYRLLTFRFLSFKGRSLMKGLPANLKKILLPLEYERFCNIFDTTRLAENVFWSYLAKQSSIEDVRKQLEVRYNELNSECEKTDGAQVDGGDQSNTSRNDPDNSECEKTDNAQTAEQRRLRQAMLVAELAASMDQRVNVEEELLKQCPTDNEMDKKTWLKDQLKGNGFSENYTGTLREKVENFAKFENPPRNMFLLLSFSCVVQNAQIEGAKSTDILGYFKDLANHFLKLAGYGGLNTKLPLDAALYCCIQQEHVISLDELYERIVTQIIPAENQGVRNVDFELPPAAEIKKILWNNRHEIAEKREKTAKQKSASKQTSVAKNEETQKPVNVAAPNTVATPEANLTPQEQAEHMAHLEHDKVFTNLWQQRGFIDFMPRNERRLIDPNGLCPGERLVPQDAASVQITVYAIYFEGKNAKKAKMKGTTDAWDFFASRVTDPNNAVAFKKPKNLLEAEEVKTGHIPLNQVQITTQWHHDMQNALENPDNPLSTYLEEAIPREYLDLGPDVPADAPASCRMVLEYINEAGEFCGKEILEHDYHEEYRRYAEACFHAYFPEGSKFHSVFTRLSQKVPDSPHDELCVWIFDEIDKAANNYEPGMGQFDTFIRNYVLGAIRKCANEHWPQDPTVSIDAPGDDDDANAVAQYRDIEQQIATQSAEDDVLQQLAEYKEFLEDLYNKHKDKLVLLERYSLTLLCGFDDYDYSRIDREAYHEFLDEADANAATEWENFVDDEMKQFGCTRQEIPIDKVRAHFNLADNDAAKQKKQQANNIYGFLHRQLTPADIYTVFKSIPALNNFEVTKSDIQNFALFGYFKLRRMASQP